VTFLGLYKGSLKVRNILRLEKTYNILNRESSMWVK